MWVKGYEEDCLIAGFTVVDSLAALWGLAQRVSFAAPYCTSQESPPGQSSTAIAHYRAMPKSVIPIFLKSESTSKPSQLAPVLS